MPLCNLWGILQSPEGRLGSDDGDIGSRHDSGSESEGATSNANADDVGLVAAAEQAADEVEKFKRQKRTEKARIASLLSRQRKKLAAEYDNDCDRVDIDEVAGFQKAYFASKKSRKTWWNPFENDSSSSEKTDSGRRRAVRLYFRNFAEAVKGFFFGHEPDHPPEIAHVLTVQINDDTNIKLTSARRSAKTVHTMMSNLQHHFAFRHPDQELEVPDSFQVHQPLIALKRATAKHLGQELLTWSLSFAGNTGQRWQLWGVPQDLFRTVKQQTYVLVADALKANDSVFREVAKIVHYRSQSQSSQADAADAGESKNATVALQVHCLIHQVSLTRRTLVLGFKGYWSCVVRLGHLFESQSFKRRFHASMVKVVQGSFRYRKVATLPEQSAQWREQKLLRLRLHSDHGHMGLGGSSISRRLKAIRHHLEKDNGDASNDAIVHWCTGANCCPGGEDEALNTLMTSFVAMFHHMVVPLLYRWKHAAQANNFIRDGFFWHRILPRTLEGMPAVQGSSKIHKQPVTVFR